MPDIAKITDHWTETVSGYILEQYKESSNWKAILKSVIDKFGDIEDNAWKLASILDFKKRTKNERPSGTLLDFCAGIVNIIREEGESDAHFYERFVVYVGLNNAGTPDAIIYESSVLSGSEKPQYIDEADCVLMVYTGAHYDEDGNWLRGGNQLKRSQVKRMAPGGVLGLPAVCIMLADGTYLAIHDEDVEDEGMLWVAAEDSEIGNGEEKYLLTSDGRKMLTSSGKYMTAMVYN